jgi:hypothetical protein
MIGPTTVQESFRSPRVRPSCGIRRFRRIVSLGFLAIAFLISADSAAAVGVRGRVDFYGPRGILPMAGAFVELCHLQRGGCLAFRTGSDGMYFFNAVPGPHLVRVNGMDRQQVLIPNSPYFDVAPTRGN